MNRKATFHNLKSVLSGWILSNCASDPLSPLLTLLWAPGSQPPRTITLGILLSGIHWSHPMG